MNSSHSQSPARRRDQIMNCGTESLYKKSSSSCFSWIVPIVIPVLIFSSFMPTLCTRPSESAWLRAQATVCPSSCQRVWWRLMSCAFAQLISGAGVRLFGRHHTLWHEHGVGMKEDKMTTGMTIGPFVSPNPCHPSPFVSPGPSPPACLPQPVSPSPSPPARLHQPVLPSLCLLSRLSQPPSPSTPARRLQPVSPAPSARLPQPVPLSRLSQPIYPSPPALT